MGRLVADPELKQTQTGKSVCRFKVAVDRNTKSQDGQKQADFISCTAWEKTAEVVSKYFAKGKPILVEGSLRNNDYTDQNGVKHYSMDVLVSSVSFVLKDSSQNQQQGYQPSQQYQQPPQYQAQRPPLPHYDASPQMQYAQQQDIGNLDDFEEILSGDKVPF